MKGKQQGFTLIELVVVIVILGILAATALPKFIDLRTDAEDAAIAGVAGGLSSGSTTNYAGCAVMNNVVTDNKCVKVAKCSDVFALLNPPLTGIGEGVDNANTAGYYLTADAASTANGGAATCALNKKNTGGSAYAASFQAIGAGN